MSNRLKTVRVRLIALATLVTCAVGIVGLLWFTNLFGWRAWRIQEVQSFIGAPLPVNASDVHFTTRSPYSRIVWLRFTISANTELASFITAMGITSSLKPDYTPFPATNPQETAINWWQPQSSTPVEGLSWNNGNRMIELLTQQKDAQSIIVYVRAYTLGRA